MANLLSTIYYLLMICAVFALAFMVFNVSLMHALYNSSRNIIFNCQKNTRLLHLAILNINPNVVHNNFKIRLVNEIKYLGGYFSTPSYIMIKI